MSQSGVTLGENKARDPQPTQGRHEDLEMSDTRMTFLRYIAPVLIEIEAHSRTARIMELSKPLSDAVDALDALLTGAKKLPDWDPELDYTGFFNAQQGSKGL